ncbi:hypothetical protein QE152_g25374 [Popillia japonica]|uniref:Uncharacterized protein n=1 Tax=Popillia japonica TaxID=7064 RepID=A0AAW1K0R2_POPJA
MRSVGIADWINQIARSLLHETITETLGYRKLSARWVPKQLTDQHELHRVEARQESLRRYSLYGDVEFSAPSLLEMKLGASMEMNSLPHRYWR